jgi:AbrB family looped-hinge helix DNA binding protein
MKAIVAERGQVTIPKSLRDKLGIAPGTVLDFDTRNGVLVARKAMDDPVSKVYGCLGRNQNTDKLIESLRGKAE